MLSCPWSIWDSFRCLYSNTPKRSFGWIAIKIYNKIKCLKVPTYVETIDPLLILQRLSELPIQQWNYKWDAATIRHIGPIAQDFAEAFAVGEDDKHICPVDAQGVAFAAIQGLHRLLKAQVTQTESMQVQLQQQQEENKALHGRIAALERFVQEVLARQI